MEGSACNDLLACKVLLFAALFESQVLEDSVGKDLLACKVLLFAALFESQALEDSVCKDLLARRDLVEERDDRACRFRRANADQAAYEDR